MTTQSIKFQGQQFRRFIRGSKSASCANANKVAALIFMPLPQFEQVQPAKQYLVRLSKALWVRKMALVHNKSLRINYGKHTMFSSDSNKSHYKISALN